MSLVVTEDPLPKTVTEQLWNSDEAVMTTICHHI
jgi:hypothetical protein